jgi:cytochrome c-type biogenesis protein CcmH/NrfG
MVRCLLGRAYSAAGNGAEATRCYNEALKVEPNNAFARELLSGAGGKEVSKAN